MIPVILDLFWSFVKIGFTSFGGLSMIPLISHEVVSHGWMNLSEVSDIVAIAEMTPGPLGLNCATFAGIHATGIPGAIRANLGVLSPTLTLPALAPLFFLSPPPPPQRKKGARPGGKIVKTPRRGVFL